MVWNRNSGVRERTPLEGTADHNITTFPSPQVSGCQPWTWWGGGIRSLCIREQVDVMTSVLGWRVIISELRFYGLGVMRDLLLTWVSRKVLYPVQVGRVRFTGLSLFNGHDGKPKVEFLTTSCPYQGASHISKWGHSIVLGLVFGHCLGKLCTWMFIFSFWCLMSILLVPRWHRCAHTM